MNELFGKPALLLHVLWLIPAVAGVFALYRRRQRRTLGAFASPSLHSHLLKGMSSWRVKFKFVLVGLSLCFVLVALARPQFDFHWEEVTREGIDIVIALDTSRSMLATDMKPSRLERAKREVRDLVRKLDREGGDRIALVAFAGTAFVQCPLTLDYGYFLQVLRQIDSSIIPMGGTNLTTAFDRAIEAFENKERQHKAIVLVTDGEDTTADPEQVAEVAAKYGIRVFTVGIGDPQGAPIPILDERGRRSYVKHEDKTVISKLDEETLLRIGGSTGGAYVKLSSVGGELGKVYDEYLAALERKELKSQRVKVYEEWFQAPLFAAFILLCAEMLVGRGRREVSLFNGFWNRRKESKQ